MNNILLINDMAGYGKVALSAMIPIMSNMKFQVYNLPTALVSNRLITESLIFWRRPDI